MKVEYNNKEYNNFFIGTVGINLGTVHKVIVDSRLPFHLQIPEKKTNGAQVGDKVKLKAIKWTQKKKNLRVEVVEVFGQKGEEQAEQKSILAKYEIRHLWPDIVVEEADKISNNITEKDLKNRFDFRNKLTITIDPDTAKDFDDAISLVRINDREWELGIHIADVTHYLKKDGPMDKEAYRRGNSTYLVGRTIPMLPEKLSNEMCSLRPNEDKLTFSVVYHINIDGEISHQYIQKGIINSNRRFTYLEAQKHIDGLVSDEYTTSILTLNTIAKSLRTSRMKEGGITFESTIRNIILNDKLEPVNIETEDADDAHNLIEEFMLLANRTVGKFIRIHNRHTINRVHEKPDKEKVDDLKSFSKLFGYKINTQNDEKVRSSINQMLEDIKGKPEASALQNYIIRTMSKAKYSTEHLGHYGLGFEDYAHFTSPIRRYSDVVVHRVLFSILQAQKSPGEKKLNIAAAHLSSTELSSTKAERESRKLKEAQYMSKFVGHVFQAVIVSIESYGVYVELIHNGCRGLIHINNLSEYNLKLNLAKHQIKKGRYSFSLGHKIFVTVQSVDLDTNHIHFEWFEESVHNLPNALENGTSEKSGLPQ